MLLPVLAGAVALTLAAAACHGERPGGTGPEAPGGPSVAVAGPESLRLELLLEPRVRAGEPVRLRLRAQNVARRPLDLYLRGRTVTFDVVVARAAGGTVWRRLEGEIIPAIVHLRTLAPGERLEVETAWDQHTNDGKAVEPGEYVVDGSLLVEGEPLRTPSRPLTILRGAD